MDSSDENRTVTLQRNPLLISTVINGVFEYLPVKDLKQCRVVCHDWNSASIQILNKQSAVTIYSKQQMTKFLELYKDYNTLAFPFTSFKLIILPDYSTDWNTEDFEQLIDAVTNFREIAITRTFEDDGDILYLTPLIEAATNLVSLTLLSSNSVVQLDKLAKVKYLSLIGCRVSLDSFGNRVAPLSISLNCVTFDRNENALQEILINDYIDFGGCSEIEIIHLEDFVFTFDMSRDVISARKVSFKSLRVINWRGTPAKANKKMLPFEKHTGMGIKELDFGSSELNLSLLPKSLEKLSLERNTYGSNNCVPVELPNLKCLFLAQISKANGTANMSATSYDIGIITSMFRLCPKLVDMELCGPWSNNLRCDINIDLMPVNLKRIKFTDNKNINLVGNAVIHVHTLILDNCTFVDTQKFMNKIKPKVVVVQLERWEVEDPNEEIASFVEESRNLEKLVIKLPLNGDHQLIRSYEGILSTYIDGDDEESTWFDFELKCYEFTNQVGKRLTTKEFGMYWF